MLPAVNRKRFFELYRSEFGKLTPEQVAGIETLLSELAADPHITDLRHAVYMLATAGWETAHTFRPIDERGSEAYFNKRYGPGTAVGKRLGNTEPGDGARFHGRGYVQLTGRANYVRAGEKVGHDLVAFPARAKDPDVAYSVMSEGMRHGWFTGKKLRDYIDGARCDYRAARKIINGTDQADHIAGMAASFEEILRGSEGTAAESPAVAEPVADAAPSAGDAVPQVTQSADTIVNTASPPVAPVPVPGGAVEDPAVKANKQSLVTKLTGWAVGTTGLSVVFDWVAKVTGLAPETQVLLVKGLFLFGIVAGIVAAVDHLHSKYIRARPDLQNVK